MAISDTNTNETEKPVKENQKLKEKKERPLTKVVVRRLPPGMDQESFLVQVSPIPSYDYMYLVKGDMSLGENAFARAYINFINASDVFMFKEKFDNYVFVDAKGHEYPAVVEFASFQKIPRKRKPRPDPKIGTIESDPYYLEFLESLKEQPVQDVKPEFSYQFSDSKDDVISTPLLDFIKQRRIDKQRIREERREERRRKELERKKLREDERKRHEQKPSGKTIVKSASTSRSNKTALDSVKEENTEKAGTKAKSDDEKEDSLSEQNTSPPSTTKDQKYEDRKPYLKSKQRYTSRSEKPEYSEKKSDYKTRRDDYREKEYRSRRYEEYNKRESEPKQTPRKTKKYSEKREERKNEARKAEQRKIDETCQKPNSNLDSAVHEEEVKNNSEKADEKPNPKKSYETNKSEKLEEKKQSIENQDDNAGNHLEHQRSVDEENASDQKSDKETKYKAKDHDPRAQRRIKNKDRPTMALYQPGMLSKRKTPDGPEPERNSTDKE